jgi:hypothetical protein
MVTKEILFMLKCRKKPIFRNTVKIPDVFPSCRNAQFYLAENSWYEFATLHQAGPQSHHHHGSSFLPKPVTLAKKSLLFGGSDAAMAAKSSEFKKPAPPVSSAVFGMLPFFPLVCLLVNTSTNTITTFDTCERKA